jgi:hypothetical protein
MGPLNPFRRFLNMLITFTGIAWIAAQAFAQSQQAELHPKLHAAISLLEKSPTGIALMKASDKRLSGWKSHVELGSVSRTDAILTRHFNLELGTEIQERQITIHLKEDQKTADFLLDLAHELTHASAGTHWDPYDPKLSSLQYIRSSIEGPGGEVDALLSECKVAVELAEGGAIGFDPTLKRCSRYENRQDTVLEFYRVGRWASEMKKGLGDRITELRDLSAEEPELFSSTGGAPYPVSLLREYRQLTNAACENSKKRLRSLSGRTPASVNGVMSQIHQSTRIFLKNRCDLQ